MICILLFCVSCNKKTPEQPDTPPPASEETAKPSTEPSPTPTPQQSAAKKPEKGTVLANFVTKIYDKEKSRTDNIKLAAKAVNGYTVNVGAQFSFNTVVGPRTAERGYQEATTLHVEGKKRGIGGGICQLSTTIYNAAQQAGMRITERHEHSHDVTYIADGKDASVVYGSQDMKFINTKDYPIVIQASVSGNESVSVSIVAG